jgi:hypothetical protein
MKIKLTIIAYDTEQTEFHFEKFIFHRVYGINPFVFTQTAAFNPSSVCRRLEKYFPNFIFEDELTFDGYESEFWASSYFWDIDEGSIYDEDVYAD